MKKLLVSIIALASLATINAQSPQPIVIPTPQQVTVTQPVSITITPAQLQVILTALQSGGITLPAGIKSFNGVVVQGGANKGNVILTLHF